MATNIVEKMYLAIIIRIILSNFLTSVCLYLYFNAMVSDFVKSKMSCTLPLDIGTTNLTLNQIDSTFHASNNAAANNVN